MIRQEQGFTFLEIIIAIALLGLLSAMAAPRLYSIREKALIKTANVAVAEAQGRINVLFARLIMEGADVKDMQVSTLNTHDFIKNNPADPSSKFQYTAGIADSGETRDSGTIGGWRVEMRGGSSTGDRIVKLCSSTKKFPIKAMISPDKICFNITDKSSVAANCKEEITVPADAAQNFYLYAPVCE